MNALGRALADHRAQHAGCDHLAIAAAYTAPRVIRAGSVAPCSVLSVREAM